MKDRERRDFSYFFVDPQEQGREKPASMMPIIIGDDAAVAHLLWQMKIIATKEVERLPIHTLASFLKDGDSSVDGCSRQNPGETVFPLDNRGRSVSVESSDCFPSNQISSTTFRAGTLSASSSNTDLTCLEHHDWSKPEERSSPRTKSYVIHSKVQITKKLGKRKAESYVGLTTKSGHVRATLRRKFSWKQYPELEGYLIENKDDYFEHSSRNYTAEQRKYNNNLTRGLLILAAEEEYAFEEFTFSMVRDRIRCYYKSYSQSARKKK